MIYILYNPTSNNGNSSEALEAVKKTFEKEQTTLVNLLEVTDYPALVESFKNGDKIVLIGGDGTLNRFINYFDGKMIDNEILFYPAGTGNDFLHDVNGNTEPAFVELGKYIESLPTVYINEKSYKFINGIGFGIDGYCCEVADKMKAAGKKKINYTVIAIKGLLGGFKPCTATVTVDGVTKVYKKAWLAPTMLGRYFGGGMDITPDQDRLNPEHTVTNMLMYGHGRLATLIVFPKVFTGEHKDKAMCDFRSGHEVTVEFDVPCALQVDGETFLNVLKYTVKYE